MTIKMNRLQQKCLLVLTSIIAGLLLTACGTTPTIEKADVLTEPQTNPNPPSAQENPKTFTVALSHEWAPFSYMDDEGQIQGILPRIITEIVQERLDIPVEFNVYPWERAQEQVRAGIDDAIFTAPTEDRLSYAQSSTESLYALQRVILISKTSENYDAMIALDDITENKDLSHVWVIGDGSAENFYLERDIDFQEVGTVDQAVKMLAAGRVDAFVHFKANGRLAIRRNELEDQVEIHPKSYDLQPFTLLISNKSQFDDTLLEQVDLVINEMKRNGEFDAFIEKIVTEELERVTEN